MSTRSPLSTPMQIEQWDCFEVALCGPDEGNPFLDVSLEAVFSHGPRTVTVRGFYDGAGVYRLRFMPDEPGSWHYITRCNRAEMNGQAGSFIALPAGPGNHGPVSVAETFHFRYADGTPFLPIGTTCYAWTHQGEALEEMTLRTLSHAPFNKVRMCVFPKHYVYNENEPPCYPFLRQEGHPGWDFTRFNPAFFRHLEQRILDLQRLGIEADLILFHPYDRWGFAHMDAKSDERYLRYVVARLAAYRNVWWSLANEWDFMKKEPAAWDRLFQIVQEVDPCGHLRSIHNGGQLYDHAKPWVTHASIQHFSADMLPIVEMRTRYRKPVVIDECSYEGNIPQSWGCLTPQEMVRLCWEGTVRGGYVGHGETYLHPQDILWWSKGGRLHGESAPRIAFLKQLLNEDPPGGLEPEPMHNPDEQFCLNYFLGARKTQSGTISYWMYTGVRQPGELSFQLPPDRYFTADIIDTWNMQIVTLPEAVTGHCTLTMPGRPYMAVRLRQSPLS